MRDRQRRGKQSLPGWTARSLSSFAVSDSADFSLVSDSGMMLVLVLNEIWSPRKVRSDQRNLVGKIFDVMRTTIRNSSRSSIRSLAWRLPAALFIAAVTAIQAWAVDGTFKVTETWSVTLEYSDWAGSGFVTVQHLRAAIGKRRDKGVSEDRVFERLQDVAALFLASGDVTADPGEDASA